MADRIPFEALGAERFERFCQALLSFEHPDLQAAPPHHADGGRDAWATYTRAKTIVVQVKFAEHPQGIRDPVSWLSTKLDDEYDKVMRLADSGVSQYRLCTNVRGTAALTRGSIDQVAELLKKLPFAEAHCLWRDDLEVRLAKHHVLKWSFRELLTGDDILQELVASMLTEERDRRFRAIRSFLEAQHHEDRHVRFRQVELQHRLSDLWIDVPACGAERADLRALPPESYVQAASSKDAGSDSLTAGAAALLLHGFDMYSVVIYGAPGQGKSTLTQYLCEAHRVRLLRDAVEINRLGEHAASPLCLPIRVELRHVAPYLDHKDPFNSGVDISSSPCSLDGFLAHLISWRAGGDKFDVSDLKAVFATAPVLLVLDGLDEVAGQADRKRVVDAIENARVTLGAVALSLQIVTTSRPSAFTNAPGLGKSWRRLTLTAIPRQLIMRYAEGWTRVRELTAERRADTIARLDRRLDDPTFAELARNAMQLAIVLTLIQRKGRSLPDKRAELYQAYMDQFLDREADKSQVVADNRTRLLKLHGYVAFLMHSQAEMGRPGSIDETTLRGEVERYLPTLGADPELLDELFEGVVDRIMAIVSRSSGNFEFEVQPLREYFAGFHLYDTKQVARLGEDRPGTLPERFDALARNPYWLNVLRFYAGQYDSGELPSLADGLAQLAEDRDWGPTDHPRVVASLLLGDQVLALNPRARERAASDLLDGIAARHALSDGPSAATSGLSPLQMSDPPVVEQLLEQCLDRLAGPLPDDRRLAVADILRKHTAFEVVHRRWREILFASEGLEQSRWLEIGCQAALVTRLSDDELETVLHVVTPRLAMWLLTARPDFVEGSTRLSKLAVQGIVAEGFPRYPRHRIITSPLGRLGVLLETGEDPEAGPPLLSRRVLTPDQRSILDAHRSTSSNATVQGAAEILARAERSDNSKLVPPLPPDEILDDVRHRFGEHVRLVTLAVAIVDGRPPEPPAPRTYSLTDRRAPLVERVDIGRGMAVGSSGLWRGQLRLASSRADRLTIVLCLLRWGKDIALQDLIDTVATVVDALNPEEFGHFARSMTLGQYHPLNLELGGVELSPRMRVLLLHRLQGDAAAGQLQALRRHLDLLERPVAKALGDWLITSFDRSPPSRREALRLIRRIYTRNSDWMPPTDQPRDLTISQAREVLSAPRDFPLYLVERAEQAAGRQARSEVEPLGQIATNRRWFEDDP